MKIIISKATVLALAVYGDEISELITGDDKTAPSFVEKDFLDDTHTNHSVRLIDGEYVMEVNDEGAFKYMQVYLKVARALAPFVKPMMGLMKMLKDDMRDIERFFAMKK